MIVAVAVLACSRAAPRPPPIVAKPATARPEKHAVERSEKRAAVAAMLTRGPVALWFDTRRAGVVVPPRHQSDARMRLLIAADARLDDTGVTTTLTEQGHTARVAIPWPAVYSAVATDGQQTAWSRDYPADLVDNFIDSATPVPTTAPKRATLEDMLAIRELRIHLDARRPGVVVPPAFRKEADLVLRIGRDLTPPIPDLALDEFGVTGTLAFGGTGILVRVPWAAIFAAVIEGYARGVEWTADIPADLAP